MGKHRGVYTLIGAADALRRCGYDALADELDAMRGLLDQHERAVTAFGAVCATLNEAARGWDSDKRFRVDEQAVAAIRSMAAQCSAWPAPVADGPTDVAPLRQAQIGALSYAIGYLEARDRGAVALELSTLRAWLVANAPRA